MGTCYVRVQWAPSMVWKAWKAGAYGEGPAPELPGRRLRIGAYGDPAAVPVKVWADLASKVDGHIGYTQRWRPGEADPDLKRFCMASASTPEEVRWARSLGWRTFRVRLPAESLLPGEFECPASNEQAHRLDCAACMACWGADDRLGRASPAIYVHGTPNLTARYVNLHGTLDLFGYEGKP